MWLFDLERDGEWELGRGCLKSSDTFPMLLLLAIHF